MERLLREHGVGSVFHLAAETIVGTVQASPVRGFETNVRGTWTLLDACRRSGIERVVVASSDKAYGAHDELPYREDFPLQATAPYEASKAAADIIARSYWHSYGLPVAVTRFANIYGGGDLNFSRLVPEATCAASTGGPGAAFRRVARSATTSTSRTPHPPTSRSRRRSTATTSAARRSTRAAGRLTPWTRSWPTIARLSGTAVEPEIQGEGNPEGEIDRQWVDPSKLRERCGWTPTVGLEEGLGRTLEWYREHPEARPPD